MPPEITPVPDWDRSSIEFNPYTPPTSGRFRKMPVGEVETMQEMDCNRCDGHVLVVHGREIVCERCPARWRDEGF